MLFQNSSTPDIHPGLIPYVKSVVDHRMLYPSVNKNGKSSPKDAGLTLEHVLGVEINSRASADLVHLGTEVKTGRDDSNSLLTLCTKNPIRAIRPMTMRFGTIDEERNRKRFYYTHTNRNSMFRLEDTPEQLELMFGKEKIAHWTQDQLKKAFSKLDRLCYANVSTKVIDGKEHFKYHSFEMYYGFKTAKFYEDLLTGDAYVDFRAHFCYEKSKLRDHGTAFRVNPARLRDTYYRGYVKVDFDNENNDSLVLI